ncbi:MAG: hypothetical protein JXA30_00060 [Deltaproteobacteria bacterium]|nr:hypothetical protein [Deltaproteobacteria bacterium]
MNEAKKGSFRLRSRRFWASSAFFITASVVIAIHIGLMLHFDPPEVVFDRHHIQGGDYIGHFYQVRRFIQGIEGWGKSWVYDPQILAGFPVNTIGDTNNKAWELWTWALWKLGVAEAPAFNTFLLLAHLLILPVWYLCARMFELSRWASLTATTMVLTLWFFDSSVHFCRFGGMVSYLFSGYLLVLPIALFYRFLREKRLWQLMLVALLTGVVHLIHPYSFFGMVLSMGVLYFQAFKRLSLVEHAKVFSIALVALGINAYWLIVALDFWRYVIDSAFYGQTTLRYLPADFFGLLLDGTATGNIGVRTGFRFFYLAAAIIALVYWYRAKDGRFIVFAISIAGLLLLSYGGGHFSWTAQIQPYRYGYPAYLLATMPAASLVDIIISHRIFQQFPRSACAALFILLIPTVQHLSGEILYFFPHQLPKARNVGGNITVTGYPMHLSYVHRRWHPTDDYLAEWIDANNSGNGRFLVSMISEGEKLFWRTSAEIIGGFPYRNLEHAYANIFRPRRVEDEIVSERKFAEYLDAYAIEWIVVSASDTFYHSMSNLLTLVGHAYGYNAYRYKKETSLFQKGSGEIFASLNRIEVSETDPNQEIVIRYQWIHTLVCEPACSIEREINAFSKVGFIKIPAPHPAHFTIRNAYTTAVRTR